MRNLERFCGIWANLTRALIIGTLMAAPVIAQEAPAWARDPDPAATGIRLIIRGDDFGSTHSSNVAMANGFASGMMTSGSLLPTSSWLTEAAALTHDNPDWGIGLHLTVTSEWDRFRWPPVASPLLVPSLVAEDGNMFHSYPGSPLAPEFLEAPPYLFSWDTTPIPASTLERRRRLTSAVLPRAVEVEIELRAQIERALRLGIRIDYLDCHMGVACDPAFVQVLVNLAAELCLPVPEQGWMGDSRIPPPLGDDLSSRIDQFVRTLDSLGPGLYRVVLHPTLDSDEVRAMDSYFGPSWARSGKMDIDVLASDEVREAIRRNSIELVSIADLWDYEACLLKAR